MNPAPPPAPAPPPIEIAAGQNLRQLAGGMTLATQRRIFHAALLASDAAALALAFLVAYAVRFHSGLPLFQTDVIGNPDMYTRVVYYLIPLWLALFWGFGLYRDKNLLGGTREYALVFNAVSVGMLLVVMATFLKPDFVIARAWLLLSWLLSFLFVAGARFVMRRVVYHLRTRGYYLSPAIVVGANDEARALAEQLSEWRTSGLSIIGFVAVSSDVPRRVTDGLSTLGSLDRIEDIVGRYKVEEMVVATSALSRPQLVDLFRRFATREDVELRLSGGLFEMMTTGLEVKELGYVSLINVLPARLSGADVALKMLLDYSIALTVAVLAAPLMLVLAVLVKLDSPGPVLHRRRVLGMRGRTFDALKFRTMYVDGERILAQHPELMQELQRDVKLRDDPRVTRLGGVMRRSSLDELPQLFNVLMGQMSIVGPRMITPEEQKRYGRWDMNLLTVKPGITGLWQISGRSDVSYEQRVQLDMNYIRNWTIWLDLHILVRTIPAVLHGRGAY